MSATTVMLRIVGLGAVIAFYACALTPLPNLAAGWLSEPTTHTPAEAIVVLGADVRSDGALGDSSLRRTIVGLLLYNGGSAPLIVFMGSSRSGATSETIVRQDLAKQFGIAEASILGDGNAMTTREEARRVKALLGPRQVTNIVIVTDSLHGRRARRVFEHEGFQVGFASADSIARDTTVPEERLRLAGSSPNRRSPCWSTRRTG